MNFRQKITGTNRERGAVMVILALTIIPLLVIAALAIDSLRMSSAHTQHENISNQIALGALQEFLTNAAEGSTAQERLAAARNRAIEIGKLSGNTNIINPSIEGFLQSDDGNLVSMDSGQWVFAAPEGGCVNGAEGQNYTNLRACCDKGVFKPCYHPIYPEADPNVTPALSTLDINAVSMTLESSQDTDGKFMHIFGELTGMSQPKFTTTSIAAMVPRNGIFLVDLSRSTQFQTHLPIQRLPTDLWYQASEYAFRLANGVTCNSLSATQGGADGGADYCAAATASVDGSDLSGEAKDVYDSLSAQCDLFYQGDSAAISNCKTTQCPPMAFSAQHQVYHSYMYPDRSSPATTPPGAPTAPASDPNSSTQHYVSDYQCFKITPPPAANGTPSPDEYYMVDIQSKPEPLTTILHGISSALEEVDVRGVAGDRIHVVAFDDTVFPSAATLTDQLRSFGPFRPGYGEFNAIQELLSGDTSADRINRINAFLFPGSNGNAPGAPRGNTDLPNALLHASAQLLDSPNFESSYNFVALFSDGMVNCYHGNSSNEIFFDGETLETPTCLNPNPNEATLTIGQSNSSGNPFYLDPNANSYYAHLRGIKESTEIISRKSGDGLGTGTGDILASAKIDPSECHELPPSSCSDKEAFSFLDIGITFHYFPIGSDSKAFAPVSAIGGQCATGSDLNYYQPYTGTMGAGSNYFGMVGAAIERLVDGNGDCTSGSAFEQSLCSFLTNSVAASSSNYAVANNYLYAYGVHPTSGIYVPVMPPCSAEGDPEVDISAACAGGSASSPENPSEIPGIIESSYNGEVSMLVCDTKNRSAADQVQEGIAEIFDSNTFAIVQ